MSKSILKQLKEGEREVRRRLILDAAKALYKRESFHSIGMRDISSEAGISVASLYQYFPSQDDLFIGILRNELEGVRERLWQDGRTLEAISIDIVDFLIENDDIFLMMSHFMLKGEKNSESLEKFTEIREVFLGMLDEALATTVPGTGQEHYSRAFFTALFGNVITFRNHYPGHSAPPKEVLYDIVRITARAFHETLNHPRGMEAVAGEPFRENKKSPC
ncbi:hypothetical protein JCM14469_06530 [Desulfatiferula olefinivorans]